MRNCRLLLLTGAILAVLAMPAMAESLHLDFYSEWLWPNHPYPLDGWESFYCYAYGGVDASITTAEGITVTLDGTWGGRTSNLRPSGDTTTYGYPRGDGVTDVLGYPGYGMEPDLTVGALIGSLIFPYADDQTITISGLTPNVAYDTVLMAWEQGSNVGYDIYANGVQVVDDKVFYSIGTVEDPLVDEDVTVGFQAVADASGVVVLQLKDQRTDAGFAGYRVGALSMVSVPEPGTLVLLLSLAGLGLVFFLCRK